MTNKFKKLFFFIKSKFESNSTIKGIKKAYNIPKLPTNIYNFYNNPLIRILRFIFGIVTLVVLTKNHYIFSYHGCGAQLFLEIIALLQVIQIVIISIIKSIYGIRKLIKNPEEFEVRNSPLNHYATLIGKLTYCWAIGCTVTATTVGLITTGSVIDQVF